MALSGRLHLSSQWNKCLRLSSLTISSSRASIITYRQWIWVHYLLTSSMLIALVFCTSSGEAEVFTTRASLFTTSCFSLFAVFCSICSGFLCVLSVASAKVSTGCVYLWSGTLWPILSKESESCEHSQLKDYKNIP